MTKRDETILAYNTGAAFELAKGQIMRVEGKTTADIVAFNADNLRERFDQARTKVLHGGIFISKGDTLYSKSNNPMLTIVDDTLGIGRHDIEFGMCSASGYDRYRGDLYDVYGVKEKFGIDREDIPDHGCWENLTEALKPWNIPAEDVPSPFNAFQESRIDGRTGKMEMVHTILKEVARIDLLAEMDCLVAVSACPWVGLGKPLKVTILQNS